MMLKTIIPNYYNKFKCKGSECKYTCCKSWNIGLGKNEYLNTKKIIEKSSNSELKAISEKAFKRIRKSDSRFYESIRLDENGNCPFWDKDGLCMLQKEFGENVLSHTCRVYPRRSFVYINYVEEYLSSSCEAVVKLFMDLPEGIEFTEGGEVSVKDIPSMDIVITKERAMERPYKFYWDVKSLVMGVMKNRLYSIEDRLILLGIAFQKIDGLIDSNEDEKVHTYIDSFLKLSDERSDLISSASKVKPDRENNILLAIRSLLSLAVRKTIDREFYIKISNNYGIKYITHTENDDNGDPIKKINIDTSDIRFVERRNMINEYFSKDREYILENVMLNTILYLNLPFRNPKLNFTDNHFYICLLYNALMFALAGYINDANDDDSIMEGIALFSRAYLHFSNEKDVIENSVTKHHFNSLKEMIAMIKF